MKYFFVAVCIIGMTSGTAFATEICYRLEGLSGDRIAATFCIKQQGSGINDFVVPIKLTTNLHADAGKPIEYPNFVRVKRDSQPEKNRDVYALFFPTRDAEPNPAAIELSPIVFTGEKNSAGRESGIVRIGLKKYHYYSEKTAPLVVSQASKY